MEENDQIQVFAWAYENGAYLVGLESWNQEEKSAEIVIHDRQSCTLQTGAQRVAFGSTGAVYSLERVPREGSYSFALSRADQNVRSYGSF